VYGSDGAAWIQFLNLCMKILCVVTVMITTELFGSFECADSRRRDRGEETLAVAQHVEHSDLHVTRQFQDVRSPRVPTLLARREDDGDALDDERRAFVLASRTGNR
jgi:hypothetical protein